MASTCIQSYVLCAANQGVKYLFVLFAPFPLDWVHFLDNNYLRGMLARTPLLFYACISGCTRDEGVCTCTARGSGMEGCVPALPDIVDGSGSEVLVTGLGDGPCGDIH